MFNLTNSLDENIKLLKDIFSNDKTFIIREFQNQNNSKYKFCVFYMDGMADSNIITNSIIMPIMQIQKKATLNDVDFLSNQVILSSEVKKPQEPMDIIDSIIRGDTVLLSEGTSEGLIISTKGYQTRSIMEPELEKTIRGPREGFTESLIINLSMIRRKLETKDLKFQYKTIGTKSRTKVCICYIEGVADKEVLREVNNRIDSIKIDGLFDVKYIHELIDDQPLSIFEMSGETEKPDVLASKLLEGRIGILLDGTPDVMTVPYLFIENFHTSEDYYTNYYFASIRRLVRILGFIITTSFPAIYLALATYHKEVIPASLLLSIFGSRQGVPFPTVVELILLFVAFEILIEAGSRTPGYIGQTLGIVGALVLGSAAVEARIVSSAMIIVVGISSISSLVLPVIKSQSVILRVLFILSAAVFGIYGYTLVMAGLYIHLFSLKSFGVLYMSTINSLYGKDLKDTYIRGPRWYIKGRLGDKK
ncbi:MAG: spore germination protein [Tissierellaceae bacterium]|nr:spore germination protein [Tissierellaceae bacterium]